MLPWQILCRNGIYSNKTSYSAFFKECDVKLMNFTGNKVVIQVINVYVSIPTQKLTFFSFVLVLGYNFHERLKTGSVK